MARKNLFTSEQWRILKHTKVKSADAQRRLTALIMRGKGKTNMEVCEIVGFHPQYVTVLVKKYKDNGIQSIVGDKRTSNNYRMTFEQEAAFLEQFRDEAEAGLIITVKNILECYEKATGKESNTSTIYKLLKRHGWRKVKPRPRHPGSATEEEKNSSKKLT